MTYVTWCHVHSGMPIYRMPSRVTGYMAGWGMCPCDSENFLCSECHQGSPDIGPDVACVHATPKISYTPNALKGQRIYGRMWHVSMRLRKVPILRMPCPVTGSMDYCIYQSNPIQAAIRGSESRCAVAGSHVVSVPSVHAVDASIYVPVMIPIRGESYR